MVGGTVVVVHFVDRSIYVYPPEMQKSALILAKIVSDKMFFTQKTRVFHIGTFLSDRLGNPQIFAL